VYDKYSRRFTQIAASRKVGCCKMFWLVYRRDLQFTWRNPISVIFLIFIACWQGMLQASIFYHLGTFEFSIFDRAEDMVHAKNYIGLIFLAVTD